MLIKIVRMWFSKESTQGVISIDGTKCGFTLEDTCRPFGVKVDGATAIPEGEYEVTIDYSEKFKKLMPHILDVPLFEGVRIHCGNTESDTSGCVLVGLEKGEDMISNCKPTYDFVYHSIEQALARKERVTIQIINAPI